MCALEKSHECGICGKDKQKVCVDCHLADVETLQADIVALEKRISILWKKLEER